MEVSFKWLRCQEWCGDAHDSPLPSRSSHTQEDVSSVPTTQGGFRSHEHTHTSCPRSEHQTGGDGGA